jgi:hypothetical protein
MSQSTFIVGALIAGFVLYLAMKNRLSVYTGVLWGNTAAATPGSGSSASSGSSTASTVSGVASAVGAVSKVVDLFA